MTKMTKRVRTRRARVAALCNWIDKGRRRAARLDSAKRFCVIAFGE